MRALIEKHFHQQWPSWMAQFIRGLAYGTGTACATLILWWVQTRYGVG